MLKFLAVAALCGPLCAFAADPPKPASPPTPVIDPDLRARFWRAQAESVAANTRVKELQEQMRATCGDPKRFILALDQAGEPSCQPVPQAPENKEK